MIAARVAWLVLAMILLQSGTAAAAILLVGPERAIKTPSEAAAVARDGDTVEIAAGDYFDCAVWHQDNLTIEGEGEGVVVTDKTCEGKALFVIAGHDVTVRNITFTRARVPDGNGAGIRAEGVGLTVEHCRFIDNENGILAGASPDSRIAIIESEFARNGKCAERCAHGIYINPIAALYVERSTFSGTRAGHHIKSEALRTELIGNSIRDGADGTSSYLVELPIGGALVMEDNVLEKGPKTGNRRAAVMIGSDGEAQATAELLFSHNIFINDTAFVVNWTGTMAAMSGNVMQGAYATELTSKGTWLAWMWRGVWIMKDDVRHWAGQAKRRLTGP
jgi:hypothetical protein